MLPVSFIATRFQVRKGRIWPSGRLYFTGIVSCIVGKCKSRTPCKHSHWEYPASSQKGTSRIGYVSLKGDNGSHSPNNIILFFSYENCSSGRWRCDTCDPCGETPALWGGRRTEELREGPIVGSGFCVSLSDEKKSGVKMKMASLQRDLCDRKV